MISNYYFFFQKLSIFGHWNGYKMDEETPYFQVKKIGNLFIGDLNYGVIFGCDTNNYRIIALRGKLGFKIINKENRLIAEVCYLILFYLCNLLQ